MTTLILVATEAEAKPLARALKLPRAEPRAYASGSVALRVIGLRAENLADAAAGAERIILAGVAGGLDPALVTGDVVVDGWSGGALPPGARAGRIRCVSEAVCDPREKARLFRDSSATAVDMESEAVRRRWPTFLHVRAILDTATDALPPQLAGLIDRHGRTRASAVALMVLRRPHLIPSLVRIGRAQRVAMGGLAGVLRAVLEG